MWLRIVGLLFIWTGCIGVGDCLVQSLRKRTRSLVDLRKKLTLLRGDVGYASATLPEAVERITRMSQEQEGFFVRLQAKLEQEDGAAFQEKWNQAVAECSPVLALSREDGAELMRLGQFLGQQDRDTQLRHLDWYLKQSEETLAEIRKGEKDKVHLYRMLSILGGAFLCIILI